MEAEKRIRNILNPGKLINSALHSRWVSMSIDYFLVIKWGISHYLWGLLKTYTVISKNTLLLKSKTKISMDMYDML